jgi:hypothetical protein
MRPLRRARGLLLRLILNRPLALLFGLLLAVPGGFLVVLDRPWESWLTDGLSLLLLATGLALIVSAVSGRTGDWIDPDAPAGRSGGPGD